MAHDCIYCNKRCFCDGHKTFVDTPTNCLGCLSEDSTKVWMPEHLQNEIDTLEAQAFFGDNTLLKKYIKLKKEAKDYKLRIHNSLPKKK